jgi:hypothetical protein
MSTRRMSASARDEFLWNCDRRCINPCRWLSYVHGLPGSWADFGHLRALVATRFAGDDCLGIDPRDLARLAALESGRSYGGYRAATRTAPHFSLHTSTRRRTNKHLLPERLPRGRQV